MIGLTLLAKNPEASVVFSDESPMAVASSRLNVETNLPEALDRCEFMINNALSGVEPSASTRYSVTRRSTRSTP